MQIQVGSYSAHAAFTSHRLRLINLQTAPLSVAGYYITTTTGQWASASCPKCASRETSYHRSIAITRSSLFATQSPRLDFSRKLDEKGVDSLVWESQMTSVRSVQFEQPSRLYLRLQTSLLRDNRQIFALEDENCLLLKYCLLRITVNLLCNIKHIFKKRMLFIIYNLK